MDKQSFLADLVRTTRQLGKIVLEGNAVLYHSSGLLESVKKDGTIVTAIDTEINRAFAAFSKEVGVGFVGEEGDDSVGTSDYILNVDPLDGTDGFIAGTNVATIIATLMQMNGNLGTPVLTVMHEPLTDRTWTTTAGEETHYNGAPLPVLSTEGSGGAGIRVNVCAFPGCRFNLSQVSDYIGKKTGFARRLQDALAIGAGQICSNLLDVVLVSPTAAIEAPAMKLLVEGVGGVALDLVGNKLETFEFGEVRGKPNFNLPNGGLFARSSPVADALLEVIQRVK